MLPENKNVTLDVTLYTYDCVLRYSSEYHDIQQMVLRIFKKKSSRDTLRETVVRKQ